jgi:F0F1-type ATP synthase beta subunit
MKTSKLFSGPVSATFLVAAIPRCGSIYRIKGVLVPIEETIRGFNMNMDGEVDELPEAAFNLVGTIDDAIEKGKKILAQAQG